MPAYATIKRGESNAFVPLRYKGNESIAAEADIALVSSAFKAKGTHIVRFIIATLQIAAYSYLFINSYLTLYVLAKSEHHLSTNSQNPSLF